MPASRQWRQAHTNAARRGTQSALLSAGVRAGLTRGEPAMALVPRPSVPRSLVPRSSRLVDGRLDQPAHGTRRRVRSATCQRAGRARCRGCRAGRSEPRHGARGRAYAIATAGRDRDRGRAFPAAACCPPRHLPPALVAPSEADTKSWSQGSRPPLEVALPQYPAKDVVRGWWK